MGNIRYNRRFLRRLTRNSSGTVSVSIPIEYADELGWRKGQLVRVDRMDHKLIIGAANDSGVQTRNRT